MGLTHQNVPEQAENKLWKFWVSFGIATVLFLVIGSLLIWLAVIHGKKVHDYAIKLLDTGENRKAKPSEIQSDTEGREPGGLSTGISTVTRLLRQRKRKTGGDVEQAGGNYMEMDERNNGSG